MKTSYNYHNTKYMVIGKINTLWFNHGHDVNGNTLDLEIKIAHMSIIVKVVNFKDGKLIKGAYFSVDLQAGRASTVIDLAERQMQDALRKCGAEFTTIREFLEELEE